MAVNLADAKKLCTASELKLVRSSSPRNVRQLSVAELRTSVSRARDLRDKFRDLAKRQRLESRGKRQPQGTRPSQSNENTKRKAAVFAEALQEFQSRLKQLESQQKAEATKKKAAEKKAGKAKGAKKKATAKKTTPKKAAKKAVKKKVAKKPADQSAPASSG